MLIKTLKSTRPNSFFIFFAFALITLVLSLVKIKTVFVALDGTAIFNSLQAIYLHNSWLAQIVVFVLALLNSMGWNNCIYDQGVLKNNSVLPAFITLFLIVIFPFSEVWLAQFLLLFVVNSLLYLYHNDRPYKPLFDSGFLIAMASAFYPPTLFFILLPYAAIFIYSRLQWRCFLMPILGFVSFTFLLLGGLYLFDNTNILLDDFSEFFNWQLPKLNFSIAGTIHFSLIVFLLLLAIKELLAWLKFKSLKSRKAFTLLFFMSLLAFLSLFLSTTKGWFHLLLFSIPLSTLLGNYFYFANKKWWYELLFILMLISLLYFML